MATDGINSILAGFVDFFNDTGVTTSSAGAVVVDVVTRLLSS